MVAAMIISMLILPIFSVSLTISVSALIMGSIV
jgi:hypothetical protein